MDRPTAAAPCPAPGTAPETRSLHATLAWRPDANAVSFCARLLAAEMQNQTPPRLRPAVSSSSLSPCIAVRSHLRASSPARRPHPPSRPHSPPHVCCTHPARLSGARPAHPRSPALPCPVPTTPPLGISFQTINRRTSRARHTTAARIIRRFSWARGTPSLGCLGLKPLAAAGPEARVSLEAAGPHPGGIQQRAVALGTVRRRGRRGPRGQRRHWACVFMGCLVSGKKAAHTSGVAACSSGYAQALVADTLQSRGEVENLDGDGVQTDPLQAALSAWGNAAPAAGWWPSRRSGLGQRLAGKLTFAGRARANECG